MLFTRSYHSPLDHPSSGLCQRRGRNPFATALSAPTEQGHALDSLAERISTALLVLMVSVQSVDARLSLFVGTRHRQAGWRRN